MKNFSYLALMLKGSRASMMPLLLPALPALTVFLKCPQYQVKYLIVCIYLGFMITRFFLVLSADRINTKPLLLISMFLAFLGSVLGFYGTLHAILFSGVLLGIGIGTGSTLTPKILREGNPNAYLTVNLSATFLESTIFSVVAVIGSGYIVQYLGWRIIYGIFIAITLLALVMIYNSRLPHDAIQKSKKTQLSEIKNILSNREYIFLVLIFSFVCGMALFFSTTVPFLVIQTQHETAQTYAFITALAYIAGILGTYCCMKIGTRVSQRFFFLFFYAILLVDIVFLYLAPSSIFSLNLVIMVSISLCYFSSRAIISYVEAHAVVFFPSSMSTATSLLGVISSIIVMISGAVASHINSQNLSELTYCISILFLAMVACLIGLKPKNCALIGSQEKIATQIDTQE